MVGRSAAEHSVDEEGKLARCGGDGLGLADARAHAAVEGAEGVIASSEAHGGHAEDLGGSIGRGLGAGAEELGSRDLVTGCDGEPRGEVLLAGPADHVEPDLREELEGSVGSDTRQLGEIAASTKREQRRTDLEGRLIGAAVPGPAGLWQERAGGFAGRLEGADAGFDLLIAAADLLLVEVVEFEPLAEGPTAQSVRDRNTLIYGVCGVALIVGGAVLLPRAGALDFSSTPAAALDFPVGIGVDFGRCGQHRSRSGGAGDALALLEGGAGFERGARRPVGFRPSVARRGPGRLALVLFGCGVMSGAVSVRRRQAPPRRSDEAGWR